MNIAIDFDTVLRRALNGSRYAQQLLDSDAGLLPWLRANYSDACSASEMAAWLDAMPVTDESSLSCALRQLRKRVMLKMLARDLGGLATLDEVMAAMTALAELAVGRAQTCIMQSLAEQFGIPTGAASGAAQELLVIGMGKLGGGELNVSSDIDLIFVFPEDGATNGARAISNHEFFAKLGRRLISMIGEHTGDGYVFRVDMRLRPYGDSGPLAMSFAALEEYLVEQGREWERYAWIKARVISPEICTAGNGHARSPDGTTSQSTRLSKNTNQARSPLPNPLPMPSPQSSPDALCSILSRKRARKQTRRAVFNSCGRGSKREEQSLIPAGEGANESLRDFYVNELMQLVRPFVFRKYLDFGAFESMRNLHAQIRREVHSRDRLNNIKLGPGGIREIEFIAQVFQLIRGGRDASLRIRATLQVLQRLGSNGQLAQEVVAGLSAAYIFLRNLEHRLQYLEDQQTQDIPQNANDRELLAAAMGYADYPTLLQQLDFHRALVSTQFERIFSTQQGKATDNALWHDHMQPQELSDSLSRLGYRDASGLAGRLQDIRGSVRYRQLPESSRQRFDQLMPQFIALCSAPEFHALTLPRVLKILESISRRASYLSFLTEYPQVLRRLVKIASASEWACDYLIQHPILLDELLNAREIYQAPDWAALDAALQQQLQDHNHDIERQLDALLQFRHSQTFRLLAMDLQGLLPLEILSDHLSDLADLILRHVLQLCWQEARRKHQEQPFFAIIAYGKLGGRELGYASDLDLIFLYDDPHPDAAEIYARLTKSINTMLGSYTPGGRLYETDLRLRPNGASGLLVSSIESFAEYQRHHAWVWEHQALTRARYCAGDARVGEKFEAIRNEVLRRKRDLPTLRKEVAAMRQKMRDGHPNPSGLFDIKHDRGGMVDIEFIVQFLVLAHAAAHPELTANSGNLALLTLAGKLGLIDAQLAAEICGIYRTLRSLQHKMRLNNLTACRIDADEIDTRPVITLWQQLFGEA